MKKILLTNTNFTYGDVTYGGLKKMLIWVGNALSESGQAVTFCTVHDVVRSNRLSEKAKSIELGIKYHNQVWKRYISLFTTVSFNLIKVLRNRYDYVISFGDITLYPLIILKPFFKFKLIVSERADPSFNSSKMDVFKRKYVYRLTDVLVCQTEGAKKCLNKGIQRKTVVIANPIEVPITKWEPKEEFHSLASVGRIHFWQKRQDLLVTSFKRVLESHKSCILNIYGNGPDFKKLQDMILKEGMTSSVVLHGSTNNVSSELIKHDIFVMTSDFEGIPNSLMEAMCLGMPVISTDCSPGGARLLINDNVNGLLTERGNVEMLASKICFLLDHPQEAAEMGNNARNSMGRFSPNSITQKWNDLLK